MNKKSIRTLSSLALAVAAASSGAYGAQLEEIIVTAQKRAESLQDVPISMTALSGDKMDDAGITSFTELNGFVPNLAISENAVNTIITMRGISVGANQSFEQSVGVYVDGIHYGKSRQIRTGLFDLQQLEVLRGPQGILFGKNTLAGAINVTTAEPTIGEEGISGKIALTAETDNGEMVEGHLNYSPSDSLAFRFAFRDQKDDGYIDNSFPGAQPAMPTTDEEIWRFTTMWEPTDSTSVKFTHSESEFERLGGPGVIHSFSPIAPIPASNALMYGVMDMVYPDYAAEVAANDGSTTFRDGVSIGGCALEESVGMSSSVCANGGERPEGTDTSTEDTALVIEMETDSGFTFTSVTGRNTYDYQDGMDADWMPVQFIGRSDISSYEQTSQEFRIASPTDQRFSWVGGVYWSEAEQEIDRVVQVDGTLGNRDATQFITGYGAELARLTGADGFDATDPAAMAAAMQAAQAGAMDAGTPSFLAFSKAQIAGALWGLQNPTLDFAELPEANQEAIVTGVLTDPTTGAIVNGMWGVDGSAMWNKAGRVSYYNQETDTTAAFFQGTYQLREDLTLTAGVRYTEEEKKAIARAELASEHTGMATPNDDAFLAALQAASFDVYAHDFAEDRSTNQLVPAVNLQWERSDTSKYYISYSEGFKSGGFNSVDDQNPVITADGDPLPTVPGVGFEYDDETAKSWEIGGKHVLMDGAMNFNWAYFNSEYEDQQVSTFVGLGFVVANAATSEIQGLEMDMAWQATDRLFLSASIAFLDGEYGEFDAAGCTAVQAAALLQLNNDAPGEELSPSSPVTSAMGCQQKFLGDGTPSGSAQDVSGGPLGSDYSGSLTANYVVPMANGNSWYAGIDVNFTDSYLMTGDLDPVDVQEGFEKVNLRLGVRGDDWDLMFFGRNITNEITANGAADVPLSAGSHFRYMAAGEIYGARFSYSF